MPGKIMELTGSGRLPYSGKIGGGYKAFVEDGNTEPAAFYSRRDRDDNRRRDRGVEDIHRTLVHRFERQLHVFLVVFVMGTAMQVMHGKKCGKRDITVLAAVRTEMFKNKRKLQQLVCLC